MTRLSTTPGELARRGFLDATRSAKLVRSLTELIGHQPPVWLADGRWLDLFDRVADPDLALEELTRLLPAAPELRPRLAQNQEWAQRLVLVLGGSSALAQHLVQHPEDVEVLEPTPERVPAPDIAADLMERCTVEGWSQLEAVDALKRANKRHLLRISARDLAHPDPQGVLPDIAAELADLADAVLQATLVLAQREVPGHEATRMAVIGLGKAGAQELNYISDVDVLFVAEPGVDPATGEPATSDQAVQLATRVAAAMTRICSSHTAAGSIWQLDAGLRPEGKAGALVRTLGSMRSYYEKWASNWEFQAMLKARVVAGDAEVGQGFLDIVQPLVWRAAEREHFLAETQAMRQRVIRTIPAKEADREIKLSSGGLRDTEFTVQLLQLVHGRADDRLRARATLTALQELVDHGYIGRRDGVELGTAYRFQRLLEHRVQLFRMRRTHLLPSDPDGLRRLGRGIGLRGGDEVMTQFRQSAQKVLRLHQRIFYSPLVEAATRISSQELALTPQAARDRLRVLGFSDPDAALRHIQALTSGLNRGAEIQRQLMPAMLGWFAEAPSPDAGMLAFRQVSESLGNTPWYLRTLRDSGQTAHRLATILSSSRYVVDLLKRDPEAVQIMASDAELVPRDLAQVRASMRAAVQRHDQVDGAVRAVRAQRRRELFRICVADLLGRIDLATLGRALSELTSATIDVTLEAIARDVPEAPTLGVIAMGRWGGREQSYGSDADAIFVHADSDDPEAGSKATAMVARLRQALGSAGPDPALPIDADLRPEGKGGPMVRSVSSTIAYYGRWADTWEAQALLRADHGAGDPAAVAAVLDSVAGLRWPEGGLNRLQLAEIRKLKARMETERMPRGQDPGRNVKLGRGGLSDVEWTVQVLQLQHAHECPDLRTTSTVAALDRLSQLRILDPLDSQKLLQSWELASRLRNAIVLTKARRSDAIPTDARDLAAMSHLLGRGFGQASELLEEWSRASRRSARVTDRLFWGRG
ncbi:bifunctional [glutamine synthetase] adenylyltransferase/[glutamine synthetase]-adenylyl-L-tyrosine phosphorylase [Aestuariimicrobium kwangyangense]|uniref:bifunctional [glutamine synthetase] adenylyltransferase/[glutamine synthetase]-adenylyl-L-tyrosine phosphorylase n=1 Tax=Aestuariimicrobium kwangyangense TaxID=396389 RepID=UPI0003B6966E|nr:bifunctional [glutamine synthetase] adenylyltransferase/[glutamine synthetase]-adenylyl-L-tyrosine phosphorylase [Aestuariimicrobium kwangyangense]